MAKKLDPEAATWADVKARYRDGQMPRDRFLALVIAAIVHEAAGDELELSNQTLRAVLEGTKTGGPIMALDCQVADELAPLVVKMEWRPA